MIAFLLLLALHGATGMGSPPASSGPGGDTSASARAGADTCVTLYAPCTTWDCKRDPELPVVAEVAAAKTSPYTGRAIDIVGCMDNEEGSFCKAILANELTVNEPVLFLSCDLKDTSGAAAPLTMNGIVPTSKAAIALGSNFSKLTMSAGWFANRSSLTLQAFLVDKGRLVVASNAITFKLLNNATHHDPVTGR